MKLQKGKFYKKEDEGTALIVFKVTSDEGIEKGVMVMESETLDMVAITEIPTTDRDKLVEISECEFKQVLIRLSNKVAELVGEPGEKCDD